MRHRGHGDTAWLAPRQTRLTPFRRYKRLVESRATLEEKARSQNHARRVGSRMVHAWNKYGSGSDLVGGEARWVSAPNGISWTAVERPRNFERGLQLKWIRASWNSRSWKHGELKHVFTVKFCGAEETRGRERRTRIILVLFWNRAKNESTKLEYLVLKDTKFPTKYTQKLNILYTRVPIIHASTQFVNRV